MSKNVLGIDLGTSSVKILQRFKDGTMKKEKARYDVISPIGWWNAICSALSKLDLTETEAVSLSSQVGTYIVNGRDVISWNSDIGENELIQIQNTYDPAVFLREISMIHPNIISYPIPRLKYIRENFASIKSVCQPKDFICEMLTGERITDPYSWRGLVNLEKKCYSKYFLQEIGIEEKILPRIIDYTELAGSTKEVSYLGKSIIPAGISVYIGMNDYFASLLGMGIENVGEMFDISGTSEHLGIIIDRTDLNTTLISGPYIYDSIHYGVTASSGASIKFGLDLLEEKNISLSKIVKGQPPIFLPYLNGERAPIWNANARGVYFGINEGCTKEELAYAAFEGVVFSLYHIYEMMGLPKARSLKISGGAAVSEILNQLKAEMFGIKVDILEENDTSALGAVLIATVGAKWYLNLKSAIKDVCSIKQTVKPSGEYTEWLRKRYLLYKEIYPAVKNQFIKLKELRS